jgi:hypothetical protein
MKRFLIFMLLLVAAASPTPTPAPQISAAQRRQAICHHEGIVARYRTPKVIDILAERRAFSACMKATPVPTATPTQVSHKE